jgi:hypothetical protein
MPYQVAHDIHMRQEAAGDQADARVCRLTSWQRLDFEELVVMGLVKQNCEEDV